MVSGANLWCGVRSKTKDGKSRLCVLCEKEMSRYPVVSSDNAMQRMEFIRDPLP